MKTFLSRQWFLIGLASVLACGGLFSSELQCFAEAFPVKSLVAFVLFLMAWTLDAQAMWHSVRRPLAAVLGVVINTGVLPIFAWGLSLLLPEPFNYGLALTAAVPCTLASAAVWTRRAGGNDAVALLVTMVTNTSCFIVTPFLFWMMTGSEAVMREGPGQMVMKLIWVVVLPMAAGQLLRLVRPMARWATENKVTISTVAQFGILTMVLVGATRSALEISSASEGSSPSLGDWAGMLAAVVVLHVSVLVFGFTSGRLLGLARSDLIAVGMAGSQKTLMVGLYIGLDQNLGIGILPMVVFHTTQLLIDTIVADRLARGSDRPREGGIAQELAPKGR